MKDSQRSTVLVVDDEPFILEEIVEALTDSGISCITASSAAAAYKIFLENSTVAVILTDLKMPGQTGDTLINDIYHSEKPNPEIIVMSGHVSGFVSEEDAIAAQFLQKPIDINELILVVSNALKRSNRSI